jgi:cytochrome P450
MPRRAQPHCSSALLRLSQRGSATIPVAPDKRVTLEGRMTDLRTSCPCETATTERLNPPRVRLPKLVQGIELTLFRRRAMRRWIKRYGRVFEFNVPFFGRCVAVADPALVRSIFTAKTEELSNYQPNLSNFFGPGSIFALDGDRHHDRRRLVASAFHGRSLRHHEAIIVDEVLRESANWPENKEFRILEPMNRITLNVILRTVFGAEAAELEELRKIVPRYAKLGSAMVKLMPVPILRTWRYSPWNKIDSVRRAFDRTIVSLIEKAEADPDLGKRADVMALLLRGGRGDGSAMSRQAVCDELVTFVGAGHETTTAALSWAFERLRRHEDVLAELVREVDEGGRDLRRATIAEVLRVRPVIDLPGRRVSAPQFDVGSWRIPRHHNVFVGLADLHENPEIFPDPARFDPNRFRHTQQPAPAWLAFGHGARRCVGADFAVNEMDIVLRTVLQNFRIHTDSAADEKAYFRGVTYTPKRGGRVIVTRRR